MESKNNIAIVLSAITLLIAGILWYSKEPLLESDSILENDLIVGAIPQQITFESNTLRAYELFKGTTTVAATSTPVSVVGAEKVTFQFNRNATTTTGTSTFQIYASGRETPDSSGTDYTRLMQIKNVAGNGYNFASTTEISSYLNNATTTVSLDMIHGAYNSVICVVTREWFALNTCNIWVER